MSSMQVVMIFALIELALATYGYWRPNASLRRSAARYRAQSRSIGTVPTRRPRPVPIRNLAFQQSGFSR